MGQRYEGTLVVQTQDQTSPTGNYVLSLLSNQAEKGDIKDNKQGYDGAGNIITGSNKGGYAGEIFSYEEMDSYLTEENVGRILIYKGKEESGEGGETNKINVGDTLQKLYFNTTVTPDFSTLDWDNYDYSPDKDVYYIEFIRFEGSMDGTVGQGFDSLGIRKLANGKYMLVIYSWYTLWSDESSPNWNEKVLGADGTFDLESLAASIPGSNVVKSIKDQDVWSSYISKDGQWSGGAPKYMTGQTYQVVNSGEAIEFKAIRY